MTSVIKGIKSWGNTGLYIRQKNSHWEYNTGGHLQYLTDKRTYRHTNTCKCMYKTHETSLHMCTCNCQRSHTHNTTSDNIYFKDTTCTYWARWIRETQHIVSMPSLAVKNTMNNTKRITHFSVTPITEHQSSMQHCLNYSYWDGAVVQQQRDFLTFSSTVILLDIKALRPSVGQTVPRVWLKQTVSYINWHHFLQPVTFTCCGDCAHVNLDFYKKKKDYTQTPNWSLNKKNLCQQELKSQLCCFKIQSWM